MNRISRPARSSQTTIGIADNLPRLAYVSQDTLLQMPAASGFASLDEALFWRDRACGIACVCMLINALTGRTERLGAMIAEGLSRKAYINGVGWSHAGLAGLLQAHGITATARALPNLQALINILNEKGSVILSVTPGLKGGGRDNDGQLLPKGGHLVLAHGLTVENDRATGVLISDPDYEGETSRFRQPYGLSVIEASWGRRCIVC